MCKYFHRHSQPQAADCPCSLAFCVGVPCRPRQGALRVVAVITGCLCPRPAARFPWWTCSQRCHPWALHTPFRGGDCAVSRCHLRRAVKLVVMELEKHNPFSSCFSLSSPAPFPVERGEHVRFLKADAPLDRLHGVKFLASEKCVCMWCALSACVVCACE